MKRSEVLDAFRFQAARHYMKDGAADVQVPPSVMSLLPELVQILPNSTFGNVTPQDRNIVYLFGCLDDEVDDEDDDNDVGQTVGFALVQELMQVHLNSSTDKPIQLMMSSIGGSVEMGLAVCSTIAYIRRAGRKVNAHVSGYAMSAGADILQACDYRTIESFGGVMLHENQFSGNIGESTTKRQSNAAFDRRMEDQLWSILTQRTGKSVQYYRDKTKGREWYLDAKQALEEQLVDQIIPTPSFAPPRETSPKPKRGRKPKPPFVPSTEALANPAVPDEAA